MRNKRGFTLEETLLVFIIIGIVASLAISSVKPWEKSYTKVYSRIYNALAITAYNDMVQNIKFPENSDEVYKALARWMNTGSSENNTKCKNRKSQEANCSNIGKNPNDNTFKGITTYGLPISNGSIIYVGGQNDGKPFEYIIDTNKLLFYLIVVDLNGLRGPNTAVYNENKLPDIVAFAYTNKFTIVPLGHPTHDMRYLQTHFVQPPPDDNSDEIISDPMPFRAAQIFAYGTDVPDFTEGDPNNTIRPVKLISEPMTLNFQHELWEDNNNVCQGSPFCVNWSDYNGQTAFIQSDVTPNIKWLYGNCSHTPGEPCSTNSQSLERIRPECDTSDGYVTPPCSIKIYDYH